MLKTQRPSSTDNALQVLPFCLALDPQAWAVMLGLLGVVVLILVWVHRKNKSAETIDRISSLAREASGIQTYVQSLPRLNMELACARRYQRPLSVAVLSLDGTISLQSEQATGGNGNGNGGVSLPVSKAIFLVFPLIAPVLREVLRGSDTITYDSSSGQYVIVFTQTTKSEAAEAVRRLKGMLVKRSYIYLKTGLAQFPVDGLTLEDLVSTARLACLQSTEDNTSLASTLVQETSSSLT